MEKHMKKEKQMGGNMYVVNIKSRHIQTPEQYVKFFDKLNIEDPLIQLRGYKRISIGSYEKGQILEESGIPRMILMTLTTYDLLDPNAFYDKKQKERVNLSWDNDIVANLKEEDLFFIPTIHRIVFKGSSITAKNIVKYFNEGFIESIGEGEIDVTIEKSNDVISRILSAQKIYSIDADITFSNKDYSSGFSSIFDSKLNDTKAKNVKIQLKGSKEEPLNNDQDGMVEAVVNVSKSNGNVIARVSETNDSSPITINTNDYPMRINVKDDKRTFLNHLYSKLCSTFNKK